MHGIRIVAAVASALLLSACLANAEVDSNAAGTVAAEAAALVSDATKPIAEYYALRRDLRRCASPLCGGYFVALVNRSATTCADGTQAAECYVAALALPSGVSFADGDLVHGELSQETYPELALTLGVLSADAVLSPALDGVTRAGSYALSYDTGIRCIRAPCPSLALTPLNGDGRVTNPNLSFVAADEKQRTALQEAYSSESYAPTAIGSGAVVFGRSRRSYDFRARRWQSQFAVSNVYVTKPSTSPVCLVLTEGAGTTAWNFASAAEAQGLQSGLMGQVELLEGRCSELALACTLEYLPVHGAIDANGEGCIESGNACGFRAAVIAAAGTESKATGTWTTGVCEEVAGRCEVDEDCEAGFCGWNADNSRICKPWAVAGEHCEGFVRPESRSFCAPGLECRLTEPTGDAGGICTQP